MPEDSRGRSRAGSYCLAGLRRRADTPLGVRVETSPPAPYSFPGRPQPRPARIVAIFNANVAIWNVLTSCSLIGNDKACPVICGLSTILSIDELG